MELKSSVIKSADSAGQDLDITFKDGDKTYRYYGAADHFADICTAPSAGKYFRARILGQFDFAQL